MRGVHTHAQSGKKRIGAPVGSARAKEASNAAAMSYLATRGRAASPATPCA